MKSKAKHTKEKPALTAEEYRLIAEEHRKASVNQWKTFLGTGVFLMAALAVIAVIAVAWFANNNSVQGNGMKVSVGASGIELRSEGVDPKVELSAGTVSASAILQAISKGTMSANSGWTRISETLFNKTDAGNTRVNWLLGTESGFDEILPGASGVLTFDVKADSVMDINLNMDVHCYSVTDQETEIPVTVSDQTEGFGTTKTMYLTQPDPIAQALVKGHILFFEPSYQTDENGAFVLDESGKRIIKYHSLLNVKSEGMTLSPVSISQDQVGDWIPVKIYWIWPLSFGQMILPDGAVHLKTFAKKGLFPNKIRDQLSKDMAAHKEQYFYDSAWYEYPDNSASEEDKAAYTKNMREQAVTEKDLNAMRTQQYSYTAHSEYSYYYNSGDQYIGTTVDYIVVSVTAQ